MGTSSANTAGIAVDVESRFHPERSDRTTWFFSYTVTITNHADRPWRLVSRHWVITDANGHIEHVRGPGVVGEQPRLLPGEAFEYTSACPLPTSIGAMQGTYTMIADDGATFDAEIAPFSLDDPESLN